jgi:hypothetical protein
VKLLVVLLPVLWLAACDASSPGDHPPDPPTMCSAGLADCDQDGVCETDVSQPNSCGGCGIVCPSGPHSSATCAHGTCGLTCGPGFDDCDGKPENGCESDLSTPGTCGSCGNSCGGECVAGACAACDDGLAVDDADPLDAA